MSLPLSGIKIIETASNVAGPLASRLLADRGANVIKIEHPVFGDIGRNIIRIFTDMILGGRNTDSEINHSMEFNNCNKRSITLDLSKERGRAILRKMLETTDVFICNFRDYELKKYGLEYETLARNNPRLILANITGYGRNGPDRDLPGYDFNVFWTRSGILRVFMKPEDEPVTTPVAFADRITAITLAYGITTALLIREKTGEGQEVDTSLLQTGIFANAQDVGAALVTGKDRQNVERKDLANVLLNSYQTRDGRWLRLAINQPDKYWARVCKAINREDLVSDSRFNAFEPRLKNHTELFSILEEAFKSRTLEEWKPRLDEGRLPWAPVSTLPEVIKDPQTRCNEMFTSFIHPVFGKIEIVANPVRLSKSPAEVRMPAPELGQHTEEVLLENGYTWEDISVFKDEGVIA